MDTTNEGPAGIENQEPQRPVLKLTEMGKQPREWTLELYPAHLALAGDSSDAPYLILREEVMQKAILVEGIGLRAFGVEKPRKLTFKLTPQDAATLAEWIGKPCLARFYLRRRYGWVLPVAVIWVLGSFPVASMTDESGKPLGFDWAGLILGGTLIVSWALARWRPFPALFLIDSCWFLIMAGRVAYDVVNGRSAWWLVALVFAMFMVFTGIRHFIRFRGVTIPPRSP